MPSCLVVTNTTCAALCCLHCAVCAVLLCIVSFNAIRCSTRHKLLPSNVVPMIVRSTMISILLIDHVCCCVQLSWYCCTVALAVQSGVRFGDASRMYEYTIWIKLTSPDPGRFSSTMNRALPHSSRSKANRRRSSPINVFAPFPSLVGYNLR